VALRPKLRVRPFGSPTIVSVEKVPAGVKNAGRVRPATRTITTTISRKTVLRTLFL